MRRRIEFEYWRNPFDDKDEWVSESEADVPDRSVAIWDDHNDDMAHPVRPVVATSMGYIPVAPYYQFNKRFEFWMGHTNFRITEDVADIIENTAGVEILNIISRYQFQFSVGRLFTGTGVKAALLEALDAVPPRRGEINPREIKLPKELRDKLDILEKQAKDNFEAWAILVLPNGEMDFSSSTTKEGLDMHLEMYKMAQELAGGVIITSDRK
jgi:hypothetical protein